MPGNVAGQGEFHHHQSVQRRCCKHHDGAKRRLHQAEADDGNPAKVHHAIP